MKNFRFLLALLLLTTIWSCQKDKEVTTQEIETTVQSSHLHVNCPIENRDVPLLGSGDEVESRQRYYGILTISDPCETVTIFVDEGCAEGTHDWRSAVEAAIASINALPSPITFEIIDESDGADIAIECTPLGACTGGLYSFGGVFQSTIQLNSVLTPLCFCSNQTSPLTACQLQYIAMHELGHALGMAHTDDFSEMLIPGTPFFDFLSVLNSGSFTALFCNNFCTFSPNDITAISTLYPCSDCYDPLPEDIAIFGPDEVCPGDVVEFCVPEEYEVEWHTPASINETDNCIFVSYNQNDQGKIAATVTIENGCSFEVEKSFTILPLVCEAPDNPPIDFESVCFGAAPVCYDFAGFQCLSGLSVTSSSPKVIVDVTGTRVCLSSIFHRTESVALSVTPIGKCESGNTKIWNITVNAPQYCNSGNGGPF